MGSAALVPNRRVGGTQDCCFRREWFEYEDQSFDYDDVSKVKDICRSRVHYLYFILGIALGYGNGEKDGPVHLQTIFKRQGSEDMSAKDCFSTRYYFCQDFIFQNFVKHKRDRIRSKLLFHMSYIDHTFHLIEWVVTWLLQFQNESAFYQLKSPC